MNLKPFASLALAFATLSPASAATDTPSPALAPDAHAHAIILKMMDCNPTLSSYRARVHVNVRMLNFPYLSPKLDGTTYFKRPDNFEVVFDRVPSYAKNFSRLFSDVGDPLAWETDSTVVFAGEQQLDGRTVIVLRMTKKIHSDILDHTDAFVDPANFELLEMAWHYTSGGTITMTQAYRQEGGFNVVSTQHAAIHIPYVHAVADSSYQTYQTNVAVDDSVFTKK